QEIGAEIIFPLDVTNEENIENMKQVLSEKWGKIDGVIHSLAFAPRDALKDRFLNTTKDAFTQACEISAFSLIRIVQSLHSIMNPGSSVMTMTYHGSQQVIPNYNVMGVAKAALEASVKYLAADVGKENIRVNAISAGPIKTLAASGISGFRDLLKTFADKSPLGRNVEGKDVGKTAVYLLSDLSSGVTGEIVYVDCGYSILGH
ncbi:MAG: enoyl-ACP reductase FabI, partial [Bacteriovoracia bacterium]